MSATYDALRPQNLNVPADHIKWYKDPDTYDTISLTLQNDDKDIVFPAYYAQYKIDVHVTTRISPGVEVQIYLQFNNATKSRTLINNNSSYGYVGAFINTVPGVNNVLKVLCLKKGDVGNADRFECSAYIHKTN